MLIINNKALKIDNKWLNPGGSQPPTPVDPYNPLGLPPNTVRVRTKDGEPPTGRYASYETATLVEGTTDVYDVYKSGNSFNELFEGISNVIEVLGANTTDIVSMDGMFYYCESLTSVPLFDTSNVTNMNSMFQGCKSLTTVPLFDTSSVTNMGYMFSQCTSLTNVPLFDTTNVTYMSHMFDGCHYLTDVALFDTSKVTEMGGMFSGCSSLTTIPLFNTSKVTHMQYTFSGCTHVQSGALALYQQASTQTNPPTYHIYTFYNCGSYTETGSAELAQIPSDWK